MAESEPPLSRAKRFDRYLDWWAKEFGSLYVVSATTGVAGLALIPFAVANDKGLDVVADLVVVFLWGFMPMVWPVIRWRRKRPSPSNRHVFDQDHPPWTDR